MDKYIEDRLQKLQNPDKKVRCAVINALGRVKTNKQKVIAPLINILADSDEDVYLATFYSLVKLGEVVVEPVIEEALKNENPLIRYRAIFVFDKLRDKRAIAPLINLLNEDEDSDVRAAAAGVLAGMPEDSQIGEALITALKDKDSAVRYNTAISLGILHLSKAVPLLIKLLKDQNEEVRGHSAFAIGQCGGSEVVEPLLPLLEDESASVRMWATSALAHKDDPGVIDPLLKRLEDEDQRVREAVIGSLSSYQGIEGINRAIKPLISLLADSSSNVRYMAAEILGYIGDKEVLSVLEGIQATDLEIAYLGHPVSKAATEAINNIKERYYD